MLCGEMWLLVLVFVSAVCGAPFSVSWRTTTSASGTVSAALVLSVPVENVTAVSSLTEVQNQSVPAAGFPGTNVDQNSAETLEELENSSGLLEGDILVLEDRNAVRTLWQDAVVFYTISDDLAHRQKDVLAAFTMISDVTCIRFRRRSNELNYVNIRTGKGCASRVGCQGGVQSVFFGPPCSVGNLAHELIHALGLYHEHVRSDRDRYVTINWNSIKPGRRRNFQVRNGDTLNLPYDLSSIMHYGPYFFSANGKPTMAVLGGGGVQIGQRKHLSPLDVKKLNRLYRCDHRRVPVSS